jgi:hypothetical protein
MALSSMACNVAGPAPPEEMIPRLVGLIRAGLVEAGVAAADA